MYIIFWTWKKIQLLEQLVSKPVSALIQPSLLIHELFSVFLK
jgi:hypothetical protein